MRRVDAAIAEWNRKIKEPSARIRQYIHGKNGLEWSVCPKTGAVYKKNGDFEWCGAFVAWCFGHDELKREYRVKDMASTYRLDRAYTKRRLLCVPWNDAQIGDILVVGKDPSVSKYGNHITLITEIHEDGTFTSIDGNSTGEWPDGTIHEGVTRHHWPATADKKSTYRNRYVYRWPVEAFGL